MWLVFLVCLWSGRGSGCAVRPCGGLVIWIVAASLSLVVAALGLVSVPPGSIRADGCRVGCMGLRASLAGVLSGCLGSAFGGSSGLFGLFLLPFVWVAGRVVLWSGWFCCLWCGSVVSFQDCTRCRVSRRSVGCLVLMLPDANDLHPFQLCDNLRNEKSENTRENNS